MTSAEGYYDSMYGRIASTWKVDGRTFTYRATVPANTMATLYLPVGESKTVKESGKDAGAAKGVAFVGYKDGRAVYKLKSGTYEFTSTR
jgi:alpha-L-rhamnosidase